MSLPRRCPNLGYPPPPQRNWRFDLWQMLPRINQAAGKAFERMVKEYPDSALVPEAKRQLEVLKSG